MDNNELIAATREVFDIRGYAYESGMSEIFNGDIYSKWNDLQTVETVASFKYDLESGVFEGVTFSLYGEKNELHREYFVPVQDTSDIPVLADSLP